ncbi:hypothetical protein CHU98_g7542 [Xylaria longipes]|nr:hypothetical protein CHU98_g7542 [Xylaria longipes]
MNIFMQELALNPDCGVVRGAQVITFFTMSGLPTFSSLNKAPWVRPNDLTGLPSLATLNTDDSSTVSSHMSIPRVHDSSRTARDTIGVDQSRGSSRPKRKRPLYSHDRCFQCRERRLKVVGGRWKNVTPATKVGYLAPQYKLFMSTRDREPSRFLLSIQLLMQDAEHLRKNCCKTACRRSPGVERFLMTLLTTRTSAYSLLDRRIAETCKQKASIGSVELHRLFQTITQARLELSAFEALHMLRLALSGCEVHTSLESTDPKALVHEVYVAEVHPFLTGFGDGTDNSDSYIRRATEYAKELHATWFSILHLCEREGLLATTWSNLLHPFIHEFYFRESDPLFQILYWPKIKPLGIYWSQFVLDSLGRTPLHFATSLLISNNSYFHDWIAIFNVCESIDATDNFGRTPLHIACAVDCCEDPDLQLRVIGKLLEAAAKINIRDEYGLLAIEYAVLGNRTEILEVFHKAQRLETRDILSAMTDIRVAVKNACDVVKGEITATNAPSLGSGESVLGIELFDRATNGWCVPP